MVFVTRAAYQIAEKTVCLGIGQGWYLKPCKHFLRSLGVGSLSLGGEEFVIPSTKVVIVSIEPRNGEGPKR